MPLYFNIEETGVLKVLLGFGAPVKTLKRTAQIEGFWLLKDSEFGAFIKLHFPSDARGGDGGFVTARAQVERLLAVPRSQKEFTRRGMVPRAKEAVWLSRDGLLRAGAWECSVGTRETPGEGSFPPQTWPVVGASMSGSYRFLSKSVLLLKAFWALQVCLSPQPRSCRK